MPPRAPWIAVVDDDPLAASQLARELGQESGLDVKVLVGMAAARQLFDERAPDAVLVAVELGGGEGVDFLLRLRERDPDLVVLALARAEDGEGFDRALARMGPLCVATKPWQRTDLLPKLRAGLERRNLVRELSEARAELQQRDQALQASRRYAERTTQALASTHSDLETATARLVEAEQLAAVGRVVTGIAHEISNQLALVGYAEAIKSRVDPSSELYEFADAIALAQKRLATMVSQIRSFTTSDGQSVQAEPASLTAVVDEAVEILRYDRDTRARNIRRHYKASPLALINREQFDQVVLNLLTNAVQATRQGDTISIEIEENARAGVAVLTIRDHGEGMRPEVLQRLGQPFFTTRGDRGSGLGVGICMSIVEAHGGSMIYSSELGVGTTAKVRIPLLPERWGQGS